MTQFGGRSLLVNATFEPISGLDRERTFAIRSGLAERRGA
jgi:hypothetical protein